MKKLAVLFITLTCRFEAYGFEPQVIRKCQTNLISYEFYYPRTGFRSVFISSVRSNKMIDISIDPKTSTTNWITETLFNNFLYPTEVRTLNSKKETCSIERITYDSHGYPFTIEYDEIKRYYPSNFPARFQAGKNTIFFKNAYSNNQISSQRAFLGKGYSDLILKIEYSNGALLKATHFSKFGGMIEYFDSNGYPDRAKHFVGTNSISSMIKNEYDSLSRKITSVQYYLENGATNETGRNKFYYNN